MNFKPFPYKVVNGKENIEMDKDMVILPKVFDSVDFGVCVVDQTGFIRYANEALREIFRNPHIPDHGVSIYRYFDDEIMKKVSKTRVTFEGHLDFRIGNYSIYTKAYPIDSSEFNGVASFYYKVENENVIDFEGFKKNEKCEFDNPFPEIVGQNIGLIETLKVAKKSSSVESTILITGESGTGKGLLARSIHENSQRKDENFVSVNCGAIPLNLIESELFGYESGAFTGANKRKIGMFEHAHNGTIFLDEIGDLPLEVQVKLLKVVQEKEISRLGGTESIHVDVRIIAATHRDLEEMVSKNLFREDLYYRLNIIPIYIPSLRERVDDIPLLVSYFMNQISEKMGIVRPQISKDTLDALHTYSWEGNIRELQNVLERMIVLSEDNRIDFENLPSKISKLYRFRQDENNEGGILVGKLKKFEEYEKEIIKKALKEYGSFNSAGKALGLTHKTVASKARKYGLV
jgi:transcriptional regulator with PAS, ATPase and Fis domain